MVGPRWRSAASKDNDVKYEDHRYRIGLANGTKDIQLMILYVTRRVFTRRLMSSPRPPATLNNQSTVMFHLRNPQMDRRIPPRTVNIFSFDKRRPGCASFPVPGWPDSAITPSPRHAYREHRGGCLRGVSYFFLPSISRAIQPASTAAGSQPVLPRRRSAKAPPSFLASTH